jgi:drug/metabolite transporter (DMT)-like permease
MAVQAGVGSRHLAGLLTVYIGLHALNGLVLKQLANLGVATVDTLLFRGLACAVAAAVAGMSLGRSLWPNRPWLQVFRFFCSGLALWLVTAAYAYANATTVTMISRLDTAILLVLGPLAGVAARPGQRWLAACCIVIPMVVVTRGGLGAGEQALGYVLAFLGTLGITMGYLFLRSSAKSENVQVVALIAGMAIAFYGGIGRLAGAGSVTWPEWPALALCAGTGLIMYVLYDLTVRLYRVMDVARAEYPTLIAALAVMPAEALLFHVHFTPIYVGLMVANVAMLGAILAWPARRPAPP